MNKSIALVGGVGLGAALMYFLDPDRGRRRRALVRDKVTAAGNQLEGYAEKVSQEIRDRAQDVLAETKSLLKQEDVTDDVLADRVRVKLGQNPVHTGAIEVQATGGAVILTGSILADELPKILKATRLVRGVKRVENQFRILPNTENRPDLQGTPQPLGAEA